MAIPENRDGHFHTMNIILGVTGSISAYKAPWLVRDLLRAGHEVRVVLSASAARFVSPLALQAVSRQDVVLDAFDPTIQDGGSWHVHLAQWAHVMLIAPCSASTLARLASGLADTSVNLVAASLPKSTPLLVAPAMDTDMWQQASTKRNVERVLADGIIVMNPESGELASGLIGEGRLPDLSTIVDAVQQHLAPGSGQGSTLQEAAVQGAAAQGAKTELAGKHVVITAGPTREAIDDVRFVANASSGRMGFALAEAARDRGAVVTLVSGPVALQAPIGVEVIRVTSSEDMYNAVIACRNVDVYVMSAAVADFTPILRTTGKMKKEETLVDGTLSIEFKKTKDILAAVGSNKIDGQIVVGFALETTDPLTQAQDKLIRKNADIMVANRAGGQRSGFDSTDNTITILSRDREAIAYPAMSKRACAEVIFDAVLEIQDLLLEKEHAKERRGQK